MTGSARASRRVDVPAEDTVPAGRPARPKARFASASMAYACPLTAARPSPPARCLPSYPIRPASASPGVCSATVPSLTASAGPGTPQRPSPTSMSTSTATVDPAARAAAASGASMATATAARRARAASRPSLPGPTTSFATSTSPAPASTMASASPTVAQVRPEVPGVSWRSASAGVRCAFTCGRIFFGVPWHHRSAAATFASKAPMSTTSTGDGRTDASIATYLPGRAAGVPPSVTLHRRMPRPPGPASPSPAAHPPSDPAQPGPAPARRGWGAVSIVLVGAFMALLDVTIVNVALPSIRTGLHASSASLEWIVSGYALSYGLALVPGGRAGDRFGPKRLFLAGLTIFTLASVGCGVAQDQGQLVAARIVQGLGAGLFFPAIGATIQHTFTGRARSRAFGLL